jgi:hypothetical protein
LESWVGQDGAGRGREDAGPEGETSEGETHLGSVSVNRYIDGERSEDDMLAKELDNNHNNFASPRLFVKPSLDHTRLSPRSKHVERHSLPLQPSVPAAAMWSLPLLTASVLVSTTLMSPSEGES